MRTFTLRDSKTHDILEMFSSERASERKHVLAEQMCKKDPVNILKFI